MRDDNVDLCLGLSMLTIGCLIFLPAILIMSILFGIPHTDTMFRLDTDASIYLHSECCHVVPGFDCLDFACSLNISFPLLGSSYLTRVREGSVNGTLSCRDMITNGTQWASLLSVDTIDTRTTTTSNSSFSCYSNLQENLVSFQPASVKYVAMAKAAIVCAVVAGLACVWMLTWCVIMASKSKKCWRVVKPCCCLCVECEKCGCDAEMCMEVGNCLSCLIKMFPTRDY